MEYVFVALVSGILVGLIAYHVGLIKGYHECLEISVNNLKNLEGDMQKIFNKMSNELEDIAQDAEKNETFKILGHANLSLQEEIDSSKPINKL